MAVIKSQVSTRSEVFEANAASMRAALDEVRAAADLGIAGGGAVALERHLSRGKLAPRDRVQRLIDPGSPFLEIGQFAAHGLYGNEAPGGGVIGGVGHIHGRPCMIVCNDATVKGGTYFPLSVKKHLRARRSRSRTGCRASISSTRAGPTCRARTRCFQTAITSGASFSIKPICRRRGLRRSLW